MGRFGWIVVGIVVLGAGILVALNVFQQAGEQKPLDNPIARANELKAEANKPKPDPVPENYVESGGILRPRQDVEGPKQVATNGDEVDTVAYLFPNPGMMPVVKSDANASTRSVQEAIDAGDETLAHRLTSMVPAPEFDLASYKADPEKYLQTIEPGRIWQSAAESEGVVPLVRAGDFVSQVLQGEKVNLETKAEPGMPVTFHSPRLGQFENQLTTITVAADEQGVARATWLASSGTRGEVEIFAASPVHSGQASFLVSVEVPRANAVVPSGAN